jgi:drug/metabolite transporter (DMT)-like permease
MSTTVTLRGFRALPTGEESLRGIGYVLGGYIVICAADAAVKWVLPEVGPAVAMLWRGLVGALVVALVVRLRGGGWQRLRPVNRRLLVLRSLCHTAVSCSFYLTWMRGVGLADTYAIAAAAPLLMTLLAIPLLGEQVGWRRWTSTAVGFCGVLYMLQPGGELWRWETVLLLVATFLMALTRVWTRLLTRTDTPDAIAFWLLAIHIPVGLALLPVAPLWPIGGAPAVLPGPGVMLALALFGAANAVAHMLFARGFGLASVNVIAPLEYSPLLWGVAIGFAFWGEIPAWTTLGGCAVVVLAGLYNVHRERLRRSAERAALRGLAAT